MSRELAIATRSIIAVFGIWCQGRSPFLFVWRLPAIRLRFTLFVRSWHYLVVVRSAIAAPFLYTDIACQGQDIGRAMPLSGKLELLRIISSTCLICFQSITATLILSSSEYWMAPSTSNSSLCLG
jgi:hypothetical protein